MYNLRSSKKSAPPKASLSPLTSIKQASLAKKASPSSTVQTPITPPLVSLLVSYIQGQKSIKPILKHLYLMICSSLRYEVCQGNTADTNGLKLNLEDTITLTVILFKELNKKLLSSSDDAVVDENTELAVIHFNRKDAQDELLLLLRCCILLVRLNRYNQVLTEQLQVAVALFRKLSIDSIQGISTRIEKESPDFNAKTLHLHLRFLQQMQEVYLDEVFADRTFLEYIVNSNLVSSTCQNLPERFPMQIEGVLEIIAAHFLMSMSGKDVLQTLTVRLTWEEKHVPSSPEVSLTVASSLIIHPVLKSAPTLILSYLICLVSEVISICVYPEKLGPNAGCKENYLSTFHDSVMLYCEHMSKFMASPWSPGKNVQKSFEFYFHSDIYNRINFVLDDLDNAWRAQRCRMFNKTISSMAIDAMSYIRMNIHTIKETFRNEVFSFLSLLIKRLVHVEVDEILLQSFKEMTVQDFSLLASILKLMSCSLLQASHFSDVSLGCLIALLKRTPDLMAFFAQCNIYVPIQVQQFVVDVLKPHLSTTNEEFKVIFLHFAGLLLLSMFSGLRILVRGCLFFMLVLMNALALKLGSLEFLRQSLKSVEELPASVSPLTTATNFVTSGPDSFSMPRKTSSIRVASNFQKERRISIRLLREQATPEVSELSDEEICDGEILMRSLGVTNREDIDELKDFMECRPWRDYNARTAYNAKIRSRKLKLFGKRMQLAKMRVRNTVRSKRKQRIISEVQSIR